MVKINALDVANAIRNIYSRGYKFGQDFVFVRGTPSGATGRFSPGQSGVEEKMNSLLGHGHADVVANWPTCSPAKVLQEGHHSMVALTLLKLKNLNNEGWVDVDQNGGSMFVSQKIVRIIEGNTVYIFDTLTQAMGPGRGFANTLDALRAR